jgi:hypothetical protein
MSKSAPYNFSLLDKGLTNTFPTSAPNVLAGFNTNYSGLMPGGSSSSGFDWSQVSNMDPNMLGILKYTDWNQQRMNDSQRLKEQLEILEPMFERRAEKQMKYGMLSNAFASLLKDVPAAIKNYAYAGRQYDPARINIAAQPILPGSSMPNMTVNIPGRSYFR